MVKYDDVVVSTDPQKQTGSGFKTAGRLVPFCVKFACSSVLVSSGCSDFLNSPKTCRLGQLATPNCQ